MKCKSGYETNVRFIDGIYRIGGHRAAGERLCSSMNIPPPPSAPAWSSISKRIHEASTTAASDTMVAAAKEYRDDQKINDDDVAEATVSCDGTWQRRGFSSKNGVATILSVNQKKCKVLDTVTLSNYCSTCANERKELKDEDQFIDWMETHKESCTKNYDGSAGSMEPHGMMIGFRRSVDKHKLQYTGYLGDGD